MWIRTPIILYRNVLHSRTCITLCQHISPCFQGLAFYSTSYESAFKDMYTRYVNISVLTFKDTMYYNYFKGRICYK
jgi:hypothetical protein